jgi:hypothetical protein
MKLSAIFTVEHGELTKQWASIDRLSLVARVIRTSGVGVRMEE